MINTCEQTLFIGQRVMARNYSAGPIWMPGTVVGKNGPLLYLIRVNGGQLWRHHIDQLKEREDTPREHPATSNNSK